jgi:osmotically-inducible protein OsmY
MDYKFRMFIIISAVSVLSFLAIASNTPGHNLAGDEQRVGNPQTARASGGPTSFERDAKTADLAITARIREAITARKDLSANARHLSIITTDGKVVLNGVVITQEEKLLIGNVAIAALGIENVDNQLVVSPPLSAPTGLRVIQ